MSLMSPALACRFFTTSATWEAPREVAAVAKSRQSCLTLCDPIDGSPPGSHPWDSPGKNIGVGCHFLLQCMKVKSESEIAQSCPTLSDPMDCSLPGSSIHGIFQPRVLEWVAVAFSMGGLLLLLLSRFSRVRLCATPQTAAHQVPPSFTRPKEILFREHLSSH